MRNTFFAGMALAALCLVSCARKPAQAPETAPTVRAPAGPDALRVLARADPLSGSRQLVLVVTPDWDSITGRMAVFERDAPGAPWRRVLAPFPVTVGRTGLAFGRGLHGDGPSLPGVPAKREGDGKAPAGAFALTMGFSYDPKSLGFARGCPCITSRPTRCAWRPGFAALQRHPGRGHGRAAGLGGPRPHAAAGRALQKTVCSWPTTRPPWPPGPGRASSFIPGAGPIRPRPGARPWNRAGSGAFARPRCGQGPGHGAGAANHVRASGPGLGIAGHAGRRVVASRPFPRPGTRIGGVPCGR